MNAIFLHVEIRINEEQFKGRISIAVNVHLVSDKIVSKFNKVQENNSQIFIVIYYLRVHSCTDIG